MTRNVRLGFMLQQEPFFLDCMYCRKKFHCPDEDIGHRVRCPFCGSAMMADIGRKSEAELALPDVKDLVAEEDDNSDL